VQASDRRHSDGARCARTGERPEAGFGRQRYNRLVLVTGTVGALVGLLAATDGGAATDAGARNADACDALAVRGGGRIDLRALERFVARGCPIDAVDSKGYSPLGWAVYDYEPKAILWLVEHGADFRRVGRGDGKTLLHVIADDDGPESLKIVDALVRRGADVNAMDKGGETPLRAATSNLSCRGTPKCSCYSGDDGGRDRPDCWEGNPRMLRALLAHGANPNLADVHGMTPLFMAITRDRADEVRILLAGGARPKGLDGNQDTIWNLMENPTPGLVRELLAHGADANERSGDGDGPLHALAYKRNANERKPIADVARLLLARGSDPRAVNEQGQTPLHLAAAQGHLALARQLIAARAPVDAADKEGKTPLHLAAWQGHAAVAALLLDHGAAAGRKDAAGLTPLHWLARGRSGMTADEDWKRTVGVLVAHGAKLDESDAEGRTPLGLAMTNREQRNLLLTQGADKKAVGPRGVSLLHLAVFRDDGDLVWRLLGGWGAKAEVTDADGRTPLHWAAFLGRERAADHLLRNGDTKLDAVDGQGRTALDWAIASCERQIAAWLLRKGARATVPDWRRRLDTCPARAEPAPVDERLHRAADASNTELIKELLDHGLPVDGRDSQGRTALHWAARVRPRVAEIQILLKRGAKVGAVDREGKTPLHLAAADSNVEEARALLNAGANVNATDDHGRTPLHLAEARHSGSFDLYRLLIDAGAKLGARDVMGRTPLHAVCDTDQEWAAKAAELFVCRGADADARDGFGWTAADITRLRGWRVVGVPKCPAAEYSEYKPGFLTASRR
jgi:ankyrin repeat protein